MAILVTKSSARGCRGHQYIVSNSNHYYYSNYTTGVEIWFSCNASLWVLCVPPHVNSGILCLLLLTTRCTITLAHFKSPWCLLWKPVIVSMSTILQSTRRPLCVSPSDSLPFSACLSVCLSVSLILLPFFQPSVLITIPCCEWRSLTKIPMLLSWSILILKRWWTECLSGVLNGAVTSRQQVWPLKPGGWISSSAPLLSR